MKKERQIEAWRKLFMDHIIDRLTDLARTQAALDNMRENMDMKHMAKEILLEENYIRFMKSYRFTFWFQLLGTLAGLIIPPIVFYIVFKDLSYCVIGIAIGIPWMCIWLPLSLLIPPTRIYRKFAKWYRKKYSRIDELDEIFYKKE